MTPPPGKRRSQPHAIAVPVAGAPVEIAEEVTGVMSGPELRDARARRPTDERIGRLETKHDEVRADLKELTGDVKIMGGHVGDLRASVGEMSGKLEVLPELVEIVKGIADRAGQREHITLTAQVDVDKQRALEPLESARFRRKLILKVAGVASGAGVGIWELVHRMGWL